MKLIFIFLTVQSGLQLCSSVPWLPPCPLECWCHEASLASIWDPLPDEIQQQSSAAPESSAALFPNDVILATQAPIKKQRGKPVANPVDQLSSLKTAICIQQRTTDIETLIARIPPQTQSIRIIQAPDATPIILGSNHFRQFSELQALVLEGSIKSHEGNFTLSLLPDALKPLQNLKYLTMKGVDLRPSQQDAQHLPEKETSEDKEIYEFNSVLNISFELPDYEIISYEIYKSQQKAEKELQQYWNGFAQLKNLRKLHLFHSRLPESLSLLDSPAFSDLVNLSELVIEHCNLKSPIGWSKGANNLTIYSLAGNEILDIDPEFFVGLNLLEYLDLSNNNISHIMEDSFITLERLIYLNLQGNPLETVFPMAFTDLQNLRTLHLDNDSSQKLKLYPDSFKGLGKLHQLWITADFSNLVETEAFGSLFEDLKHVREIHLRGNLSYLGPDVFVNQAKLTILDLKECNVEKLSVDSFQGLQRLQVLDLSRNALRFLLPSAFDPLTGLRELWLNNNLLTTVPKDIFANIPAKLIRLENNPWHCDCRLGQLNPTAINKVRVQPEKQQQRPTYTYDRKVSPTCMTPKRFRTWSVFDVMRKELKCKKNMNNSKKSMTETNLTKDPWNSDEEKEFDVPMETVFEFYEDPDVIEHGPQADSDEESIATGSQISVTETKTDDYDEHGPEIIEETSTVQSTTTTLLVNKPDKIENALPASSNAYAAPPSGEKVNYFKSALMKAVKENPFFTEKLSKKSLKLLLEEERTKMKSNKETKNTIDNSNLNDSL